MKRLHHALLTIALLAAAALFAQEGPAGAPAEQGAPGGPNGPHFRMPTVAEQLDRLSNALNLTDDQKPQVKAVLEEQHAKMQKIMENRSGSREDNMSKMHEVRQTSTAKLRALLTDEQKAKFDKMEAEHKHMGDHHGDHEGPPPPPNQQ